ncbi:hypothetical protein H4R19_003457 [Coemansia spiralis]|nr:hypothetical protein H4R19_003457 [Coemansia spiralis]
MRLSLQPLAALALLACSAQAHTILTRMTIGGEQLKVGKCIRTWWTYNNYPVQSAADPQLRCRTLDTTGATTQLCPVAAGSQISGEFNRNKRNDGGVLAPSHQGPVLVYIAPLESNGIGNVWVKIYEDGWNNDTKWATDRLINNNGILTFTIPACIKPGNYLLRTEIIALHGSRRIGGTQFFPNCAHIAITGNGKNTLPAGVSFPGAYDPKDPGILYLGDKNGDNSKYVIPGPPVYKPVVL